MGQTQQLGSPLLILLTSKASSSQLFLIKNLTNQIAASFRFSSKYLKATQISLLITTGWNPWLVFLIAIYFNSYLPHPHSLHPHLWSQVKTKTGYSQTVDQIFSRETHSTMLSPIGASTLTTLLPLNSQTQHSASTQLSSRLHLHLNSSQTLSSKSQNSSFQNLNNLKKTTSPSQSKKHTQNSSWNLSNQSFERSKSSKKTIHHPTKSQASPKFSQLFDKTVNLTCNYPSQNAYRTRSKSVRSSQWSTHSSLITYRRKSAGKHVSQLGFALSWRNQIARLGLSEIVIVWMSVWSWSCCCERRMSMSERR